MLLVASWIFYGLWDGRFVLLLIASAFLNWGVARLLLQFPRHARALLVMGVTINLMILAVCKYFNFFRDGLNNLLAFTGWHQISAAIDIAAPIGVSFFTFQGISYIVDVWKKESPPARLLELALLMSFFPHLVSGPIVRPSHILPQLRERPWLSQGAAATSLVLIVWGLFKKAVIANELAINLVDPVFKNPTVHSAGDLILAAYAFSIEIYCDFSAYSDMAVGFAGLLGFRFPFNFNQPYQAKSIQDFWRRWHISLSSWLRDYLYINGFGGNRLGPWKTYRALILTMLLGGLWHGASLNFVIWGGLHGFALALERLWSQCRPIAWPKLPGWACWLLTFHFVTLTWVFFNCHEFGDAMIFLGRIVQGAPGDFITSPWSLAMILLGLACHFGPADAIQRLGRILSDWPSWLVGLLGALALIVVEGLRGAGVAPFIYFQF